MIPLWWVWAIFCFFLYEVGPFILTYNPSIELQGIKRICQYVYKGRLVLMESVLYGVLGIVLFHTYVAPAYETLVAKVGILQSSIVRAELYWIYPFVFYWISAYGIHVLIGTAMVICFLSRRHIKNLNVLNIDGHWGFKSLGFMAERNVIFLACSHGIVAGKFIQLPFEVVYQPGPQFVFFGFILILMIIYALPVGLAHLRIKELKESWVSNIQRDIRRYNWRENDYFKEGAISVAENMRRIVDKFGETFEHLKSGSDWPSDFLGFGKVLTVTFLSSLPAYIERLIHILFA